MFKYIGPFFRTLSKLVLVVALCLGHALAACTTGGSGKCEVGSGHTYSTIASCNSAATSGQTCLVFAGNYNESVTITAGVTIQANGTDVVTGPSFTLGSNSTLLGNCTSGQYNAYGTCGFSLGSASGGGTCLSGGSASNAKVVNNVIESCGSYGLDLGGNSVTDQIYIGGNTLSWACTPQFSGVSVSMSGATATFTGSFTSTSSANNYVYTRGFSVAGYNNVYWLISAMSSTTITATSTGITGLASASGGTVYRDNACTSARINGTHNLIENNDISHSSDGPYMGGEWIVMRKNSVHDMNVLDCNSANSGNNCHIDFMQVDGSGLSNTSEPIQFVLEEKNTVSNMLSSGPVGGGGTHCIGLFQNGVSATHQNAILRFHTCEHIDGGGLFNDENNWANLKTYNNSYIDTNRTLASNGSVFNSFSTGINSSAVNDIYYYTIALNGFGAYECLSTACPTFTYGHSDAYCTSTGCSTIYSHTYGSGTWTNDPGNIQSNPLFTNYAANNFTLTSSSPARNAGTGLTTVNGTISNSTTLVVADPYSFQDGWGITNTNGSPWQADCIWVTSVSNHVCISSINYATSTITLSSPISATNGDQVGIYSISDGTVVQTDTGVDMGAIPYSSSPTTPVVTTGTAGSIMTTTTAVNSNSYVCTGTCTSVTSEGTCYATTANPTTPCTSDGTSSPFNSFLSGLTAGTVYHFRAFATNSVGTAYGSDQTFTTGIYPPVFSMITNISSLYPFDREN